MLETETAGRARPRHTRRRWYAAAALVALVGIVFVVQSSRTGAVATAEHQLNAGYLDPLTRDGLATEVLDACHYERTTPQDAWHFSVKINVQASTDAVVNSLAKSVGVVRTDHDPIIIQQFKGEPNRGWNGIVEPSSTGTLISVVKNNVDVPSSGPGVGWLPICPETRG